MQQFTVPQFIDVEDKIIGPITVRQFLIMLIAFMLIAAWWKFFDFTLFVTSGLLTFGIFGIIAFFKVNGMPFHYFVLNFVQTASRSRVRVWNNVIGRSGLAIDDEEGGEIVAKEVYQPRSFSTSRLAELSLIVDTQGSYQGESKQGGAEVRYGRRGINNKI